jgi:RIO kinase 1
MKVSKGLRPLMDDGVIDEVVRSLKRGEEATAYIVRWAAQLRCAKVYRDMAQRSFQRRARYQEGRKVRGGREARAMSRASRFGRREQEHEWKSADVDALRRPAATDVHVSRPCGYFNAVLITELITDAAGNPAPGLGEVTLTRDLARASRLSHAADRVLAEAGTDTRRPVGIQRFACPGRPRHHRLAAGG